MSRINDTSAAHPNPLWKKYHHFWKKEVFEARSTLLREGDVCRRIFVIDKGCIRAWFNHDGREISFQFFFEGDVVYAQESFRKNLPSPFSLETVEPVKLHSLDQHDMTIIRQDADLYPFLIENAINKQAEFMLHFFSYLKDTPEQRYRALLRERPEIVRRIPLQHIASYLGITPVSLSRIRNRIS